MFYWIPGHEGYKENKNADELPSHWAGAFHGYIVLPCQGRIEIAGKNGTL